jgi:CHASE2 domain-containing sensor protein
MDTEALIWIYLPMVIATIETIWSLKLTIQKKSTYDLIASFLILTLNGLAVYILIAILNGGWPTYTPHLAILISTSLIMIQIIRHKKNKTFGNN